jgi:hypothetical protein
LKLKADFGTPEFWREYADILSAKAQPKKVTSRNFVSLIDNYHRSPHYCRLKPRTALDYDKYLTFFCTILGDANPALMK